jgi:hypothetical protein
MFRQLDMFPSSGEGRKSPTRCVPLREQTSATGFSRGYKDIDFTYGISVGNRGRQVSFGSSE